jgi:hypothetical protein
LPAVLPQSCAVGGRAKLPCRAVIGVEKATRSQLPKHRFEMCRRAEPRCSFQPVLVEQRGEGRVSEFGFPENAEKRGKSLFRLARQSENRRGAICLLASPGFRSGTEAEIDDASAGRCGQLKMCDLMDEDIGLRVGPEKGPIPGVSGGGRTRNRPHAEARREIQGFTVMPRCCFANRPYCLPRIGETLKNLFRGWIVQSAGEGGKESGKLVFGNRCQNHAKTRMGTAVTGKCLDLPIAVRY